SRAGVPPADGEAAGSSSTGILPVDGAKRRPPMPAPTRARCPRYFRNTRETPVPQRLACPVFEMRPRNISYIILAGAITGFLQRMPVSIP
ncbi:MAG: hypothetical protein LBM04_00465, partial [Opitutaceae bacterium]|nr:hypothetical protein [Opitutaceae bacterium]